MPSKPSMAPGNADKYYVWRRSDGLDGVTAGGYPLNYYGVSFTRLGVYNCWEEAYQFLLSLQGVVENHGVLGNRLMGE